MCPPTLPTTNYRPIKIIALGYAKPTCYYNILNVSEKKKKNRIFFPRSYKETAYKYSADLFTLNRKQYVGTVRGDVRVRASDLY